ncbi:MAG: hypothetical protein ACREL7_05990 [Longimicrobiales bacterium]
MSKARNGPWLLVLMAACVGPPPPQQDATICDSCAVALRPVAALDFADAPFMPSMFVNVEQMSDGTFGVVDLARGGTEILHFASTGVFVDSHLMRGAGPGEAMRINALLAIGDSLLVIDEGTARCTMLDAEFEYIRDLPCFGNPLDAAHVDGRLYLTGLGPMELVEIGLADGEREQPKWEGVPVPVSDDYASIAGGSDGVWFAQHPNQYRMTYWRTGETNPSRVIERTPAWWQDGEPFLMDLGPNGVRGRIIPGAEERQVMRGPLLFNIAVSDGFIWTASYIHTRQDRQYFNFLEAWLGQGLQGDVIVFVEALTPEGELIAVESFDDLAPPRFTAGGLMYTVTKEGHGTGVTLYQPKVVRRDQ